MNKLWLTLAVLGSLLPGLSACGPSMEDVVEVIEDVETAVPTVNEPVVEPTESAPTAPAEIAEISVCDINSGHVFHSEEGGYCFAYPEDYCWFPGQVAAINSFVSIRAAEAGTNRCPDEPLLFHGEVVWVAIYVEPANGQTLDQFTARFTARSEDFGLEVEEVMLAGETAVQINNMPGQDIGRELLTVRHDQFYRLLFVPASADYGDRYTQMQDLYAQVLASFQFLP